MRFCGVPSCAVSSSSTRVRCTSSDVSLPVLPDGRKIKSSKYSRWRAAALIAVHVVMIVHIVHWLVAGMTLSPVEPSESMYAIEQGRLNAGFVFFVLALLSTILFGRFFCGWGCHIIALQDLCTWLMEKCKVRPKPFRARLLLWGPLLLALYMFVWPTFKREALFPIMRAAGISKPAWLDDVAEFPGMRAHFFVSDFWATFAPWYIGIPFLLVCGVAVVYFLGNKGFCTYGCPYGGFFAPLDKISFGRIVVSDACDQCGHCTAACTSNVRVHQEVKDYGKIIDPGCMKCLDCVSVCPNDALSFKFAAPAVLTKPRVSATELVKARRPAFDLSWGEELVFFAITLALFMAFRQMLGLIPLLMAGGLASIGGFAAWKLWRLVRDENVRLQSLQLKLKGRWKPAGAAFAVIALAYLGLGGWSGWVRLHLWRGGLADDAVRVSYDEVFSPGYTPKPEVATAATRAIDLYLAGGPRVDGGVGWRFTPPTLARLAWLEAVRGDYAASEHRLRQSLTLAAPGPDIVQSLARLMELQGKQASDIIATLQEVVTAHPEATSARAMLARGLAATGQPQQAFEQASIVLGDSRPGKSFADAASAASLMLELQKPGEAAAGLAAWADSHPKDAVVQAEYARALFFAGKPDEAIGAMRRATDLAPTDPRFFGALAELLATQGRTQEAEMASRKADELARQQGGKPGPG